MKNYILNEAMSISNEAVSNTFPQSFNYYVVHRVLILSPADLKLRLNSSKSIQQTNWTVTTRIVVYTAPLIFQILVMLYSTINRQTNQSLLT